MDSRILSSPRPEASALELDSGLDSYQAVPLGLWAPSRDLELEHMAETEWSPASLDSKQLECRGRQETADNRRDKAVGCSLY
jgi:hypothetical protein